MLSEWKRKREREKRAKYSPVFAFAKGCSLFSEQLLVSILFGLDGGNKKRVNVHLACMQTCHTLSFNRADRKASSLDKRVRCGNAWAKEIYRTSSLGKILAEREPEERVAALLTWGCGVLVEGAATFLSCCVRSKANNLRTPCGSSSYI